MQNRTRQRPSSGAAVEVEEIRAPTQSPLSIAMIAPCPFPTHQGTQVLIRHLSTALARAGHDVHLVTYGYGEYEEDFLFHLHRAAKRLVAEHGGALPDDPAVWRGLPGVGRYILGAVLSQAFDRRLPVVEANTVRVLCRLFGQAGDPKSGPVQQWLWARAEELLPRARVGDFNQAMMELGALVCTAREARCGVCPVRSACATGRREGGRTG